MHEGQHSLRFGFVSTMNGVPWGGSEQLWSETALLLRRQGHHVAASVFRWPIRPTPLRELEQSGIRLSFRPLRRGIFGRTMQKCLVRLFPHVPDFFHYRWLKRNRLDLVVVSQGGPWDGLPWMAAARRLGVPYCNIVQANSELWWPLDEHMTAITTAMTGASRVYFVSQANRRLMGLQCGASLPNGEVISNPCKVDRTVSVPWPQTEGTLRIACVGRMAPNAKGQDILFEVLAQPKWKARAIEIHLYGTGPSEKSIKSLAAHLELTNVFFHGQVSDIRGIWAENHALVLPSRFEGLPLTIIEAMLCSRMVITTAVAGNTEVVTDNLNGFIAAAATVPLLDDALERAWIRRSGWREMGQQARASALNLIPQDPVGDFAKKLVRLAVDSKQWSHPDGARSTARVLAAAHHSSAR